MAWRVQGAAGGSHGEEAGGMSEVGLTPELVRRFGLAGPRYTSYPTADRFDEGFGADAHAAWLEQRGSGLNRSPLSVYIHVPFCASLCYYCACNKIVTKDRRVAASYVEYLEKEIALQLQHLAGDRGVCQLHWGGGTPTFLDDAQIERLMATLTAQLPLATDAECSIEIDPRTVSPARVARLAQLGFNRMSIGVQDFDEDVQRAVHRVQPAEQTFATIAAGRANGFKSINLDLIYGLPRQTLASFGATLDRVIDTGADRIALYNYAHLPARFKPQRRIDPAQCPDADTRVRIFLLALAKLTGAGYVYVGLDHFAKPDDELAVALRTGRLQRNFQGYSTRPDCDLLALGVSGISKIGPTYSQNVRTLAEYRQRLDADELPVMRGYALNRDDIARRAIIMALMCQGEVSMETVGSAYFLDFKAYFARELEALAGLQRLGLVSVEGDWISVTAKGRLLVRAVCMIFDKYLQAAQDAKAAASAGTAPAVASGGSYSSVV
jgi:oxygen-independent coproporphyrinogen-3 oxidase